MNEKNLFQRDLGSMRKSEWIGTLIYWPFFLIISQLAAMGILLLVYHLAHVTVSKGTYLIHTTALFTLINAVVLVILLRRYLADQFRRLKQRGWAALGDLVLDFLLYFALLIVIAPVSQLLLQLFKLDSVNENQETVEIAMQASPWLGILSACLLAPIAEELLNRGLVFRALYKRSPVWGYLVSMLVFSLIHVYSYVLQQHIVITLVNILAYLPAGFALARVYERSGSIWTSILLHCCINLFATMGALL